MHRDLMEGLVKRFGRKAVEDAVPASQAQPGFAELPGRRAPDAAEGAGDAAEKVLETLAPPSWWHSGQRSLTAPNLRRADISPQGFDQQDNAQFEGTCPKCHGSFLIKTDTLRATCRCESVTWRMNVAIITHDFPPHSWHPETIRKTALRSLHANNHWEPCKASAKLLMDLQAEFEDGALFCSILEV